MSETREYDLVILGSGSGNTIIDESWRDRRVAIVDSGIFGGTCLNVGCIPTKMFAYPAATALHGLDLDRLGVRMYRAGTDWAGLRDRIFGRIDPISEGGLSYRQGQDFVEVFTQEARLQDPRTLVLADGTRIRGRQLVLAAGARAVLPQIPGIDLPGVHTSDTIMRLEDLPETVVILGGGFIAAEFATIFTGLGSRVIQVNRSGRLLREHDEQIAERFRREAARRWDLRTETEIERIEQAPDAALQVHLVDGRGPARRCAPTSSWWRPGDGPTRTGSGRRRPGWTCATGSWPWTPSSGCWPTGGPWPGCGRWATSAPRCS